MDSFYLNLNKPILSEPKKPVGVSTDKQAKSRMKKILLLVNKHKLLVRKEEIIIQKLYAEYNMLERQYPGVSNQVKDEAQQWSKILADVNNIPTTQQ